MFSEISMTEAMQPTKIHELNKDTYLSGKKIKSMTILKDKSTNKKSTPKTSFKKTVSQQKQVENAENILTKKKKKTMSKEKYLLDEKPMNIKKKILKFSGR